MIPPHIMIPWLILAAAFNAPFAFKGDKLCMFLTVFCSLMAVVYATIVAK